jgi:hypothetical protein
MKTIYEKQACPVTLKPGFTCGEKATKLLWPAPKTAMVIVGGPALKQNAPSFPDSGSGSQQ